MIGLVPAGEPDWDLLRRIGIGWLREGVGLPFGTAADETPERYRQALGRIRERIGRGYGVLGVTPGPGGSRYDPGQGRTFWQSAYPDWAGQIGSQSYYQVVGQAAERIARDLPEVRFWQIANEPDVEIFRGPLTDEQLDRFLLAAARGVKRANPSAMCGINLGVMNDERREFLSRLYGERESPWGFIGLDGYYGSWHEGGPETWEAAIDEAHRITRLPVIIHEWGYSSLQSGPILADPLRMRYYNQPVCRDKRWHRVWRSEHSPAEQAQYVRTCVRIFAEHPHCIGNFFFRYGDTETCWQCGKPLCPAECAWGMVDVQGRPKPVADALARAIRENFGP
jgi:hypothetical protein